ncbi:MAG: 30S ribosome-binding factor RbfA [Candidatus Cloacimonadota bacterium]|nr:30S ribosome-binding factor RbfA [Candidatus Cloacimonadota bacterium]
MSTIRVKRMEKELLKIFNNTLEFIIRDKRLQWVTISDIRLSSDFSYVKVYFTHLSDIPDDVLQGLLTKSSGVFKDAIAKAKFMRVIPELNFMPDDKAKEARRLEEIFAKIHSEKKENNVDKDTE